MADRPVFLYAAIYDDIDAAESDYEAVFDLHAAGAIGTFDSAVIRREEDGKVRVTKTEKPTQHGAWTGAGVGALVGILFPPAVLGAAIVGAGAGPWFMWDVGASVWAGGLTGADPLFWNNPNNPSLEVKFALGFHKSDPRTSESKWALRMADVTTATVVTTAEQGALPRVLYNGGAVVLGINSYNSNDSWGTFYEGAIVAGFPADDTELSILQNIQAVGYGR